MGCCWCFRKERFLFYLSFSLSQWKSNILLVYCRWTFSFTRKGVLVYFKQITYCCCTDSRRKFFALHYFRRKWKADLFRDILYLYVCIYVYLYTCNIGTVKMLQRVEIVFFKIFYCWHTLPFSHYLLCYTYSYYGAVGACR